jgi:hypothetical protein
VLRKARTANCRIEGGSDKHVALCGPTVFTCDYAAAELEGDPLAADISRLVHGIAKCIVEQPFYRRQRGRGYPPTVPLLSGFGEVDNPPPLSEQAAVGVPSTEILQPAYARYIGPLLLQARWDPNRDLRALAHRLRNEFAETVGKWPGCAGVSVEIPNLAVLDAHEFYEEQARTGPLTAASVADAVVAVGNATLSHTWGYCNLGDAIPTFIRMEPPVANAPAPHTV